MDIQDRSQHGEAALRADSQLEVHYRGTGWVCEQLSGPGALGNGPRPGDRAPDVQGLRREGLGFPLRLFDLLRGPHHTLLLYGAAGPVKAQPPGCGAAMKVYVIATPGAPASSAGCPVLVDSAGQFQSAYAAAPGTAYLIRPDGYVGFRTDSLTQEGLDGYLDRVFSRR
jgi:hypothetical protein